jgi:hypothetical protein
MGEDATDPSISQGELLRTPLWRSSVYPGPMGENFSGSCIVTSRNPLIHKGATNGTKSPDFDA